MKKLFYAVAAVCLLGYLSCKSNDTSTPTEVLSQFFDAMAKKDSVKIKALTTEESASMINMMTLGMDIADTGKLMGKYDKSKVEFGTAVINGDNAKVPVKEKASGETVNFPLKKVNGKWKVAFDKTSIMDMGMEKIKDGKMNIGDSLQKGMEEMKSMNMDSVMNEIKKSMDTSKIISPTK